MFLGRSSEIDMIEARLTHRRLVTLVGPAGVGKTTLATQIMQRLADGYDLGGRSVDLTAIGANPDVHRAIAGQLGYPDFASLIASPLDLSVLLLIDNCEHVVDDAAEALDQLLEACAAPTVIATSRRPLDLPAETVISIGPLPIPLTGRAEPSNPCIEIFVNRANDVGADPGDDLEAIGEICRRLDGVPLAIELAASRTRSMTVTEILDNLDHQLDLLQRPRFRGASRHKSLRAAIEWSHRLLEPDEHELFRRLAVMSGTFDAAAAHAVSTTGNAETDTRDLLDRLVDSSLVAVDTSGDRARYRLLESIRAFAREHLEADDDLEATMNRMTDHVIAHLTDIIFRTQAAWEGSIVSELLHAFPMTREAIRWAVAHDDTPDRAYLMVAVCWGLIHQAHTSEIVSLAEAAFERWPERTGTLAPDAAATLATGVYLLGDTERAIELVEEILPDADAGVIAPVTLRRVRAQAAHVSGDTTDAVRWFEQGAAVARQRDLAAWAIELDIDRAAMFMHLDRPAEALELVRTALVESERARSTITSLWGRAVEAAILTASDAAGAIAAATATVAACREADYPAGLHAGLRAKAIAELTTRDASAAAGTLLELLDALMMNGSLELHMAIGPAVEVLQAAGRTERLDDIIASWHELPVMSMLASGTVPPTTKGMVLGRSETIRVVRAELRTVVDPASPTSVTSGERASVEAGDTAATENGLTLAFRREGDFWAIEFDHRSAIIKHSKGMSDLATLLAEPGREFHCLDLMGAGSVQADVGPTIDTEARRSYEERVRELQTEIDEAERFDDIGRAERARQELDAIVDELVRASGLGGRDRRAGGDTERARSAVTQRIRSTLRRLDGAHPAIGQHLSRSVQTGVFCSYTPDDPTDWDVSH